MESLSSKLYANNKGQYCSIIIMRLSLDLNFQGTKMSDYNCQMSLDYVIF